MPPPIGTVFVFDPENVDECLYLRGPSSTVPGAHTALQQIHKGNRPTLLVLFLTRQKPRRKRHLEGSGGEAVEALFINVDARYQERGRLDSSWGTNSMGDDTALAGLNSAGPQALPAGGRAALMLPTCRALRNPAASSACLPLLEWRVQKSSGGKPRANARRAPLCQLKGVPKARAALTPNSRRQAPQIGAFCLRRLGSPKLGTGFLC